MQQFPNTAFEIAPTGDYFGDQYYRELTEKYTGKARVENGSVSFEGAGVPFPLASLTRDNPQAGVQTAYNMYLRKRGSNHGNIVYHEGWMMFMSENASRTSPDGLPADTFSETVPIERMLGIRFQETQYSFIPAASQTGYRLDLPDAASIYHKNLLLIFAPYDMRGSFLNLTQYRKDTDDDVRMYIPQFRQARRVSGANRADAMFGSVWTLADLRGNNDKPSWWQWRHLGYVQTLHPMNIRHPYARFLGSRVPNDVWEVRQCAIVDATPNPKKYASHLYSHKVFCIDTNTWDTLWFLTFDQSGNAHRAAWIPMKWSEDETGDIFEVYSPEQDDVPRTKDELLAQNKGRYTIKQAAQVGWDLQRGETTVYINLISGFPELPSEEAAALYDHSRLMELHR